MSDWEDKGLLPDVVRPCRGVTIPLGNCVPGMICSHPNHYCSYQSNYCRYLGSHCSYPSSHCHYPSSHCRYPSSYPSNYCRYPSSYCNNPSSCCSHPSSYCSHPNTSSTPTALGVNVIDNQTSERVMHQICVKATSQHVSHTKQTCRCDTSS